MTIHPRPGNNAISTNEMKTPPRQPTPPTDAANQPSPPPPRPNLFRRGVNAITRGFRAWLNLAPGCSACNTPFDHSPNHPPKNHK